MGFVGAYGRKKIEKRTQKPESKSYGLIVATDSTESIRKLRLSLARY